MNIQAQKWKTIPWNRDYEISSDGMIRRRLKGVARMRNGTYLMPFSGKNNEGYYSLQGTSEFYIQRKVKSDSSPKMVKYLMEDLWPEIQKRKYGTEWVHSIRTWINNNRKKANKEYLTRKINQDERTCRKCGKPSGVNYWCASCHAEMAEFDSGYPSEGYSVGEFSR